MTLASIRQIPNSERKGYKLFHARLSPEAHDHLLKLRAYYGALAGSVIVEALLHDAATAVLPDK